MRQSSEIFAQFTIGKIKTALKDKPLTPEQQAAVLDVLRAAESEQRHSLDLRLFVPLIFRNFYIVILAGRDRRRGVVMLQRALRQRTLRSILRFFVISASILLSFVVAALLVWALYWLKSALGIDIFPGWHFSDLVSNSWDWITNADNW